MRPATDALSQDNYEDPLEFKGFRCAELREREGAGLESIQHQMVSLDLTDMLFGYGRNAWCAISRTLRLLAQTDARSCSLGRFFAVNEVKVLLAHIILNYDLKLPGDSRVVPEPTWSSVGRSSNPILYPKRKSTLNNLVSLSVFR